MRLIPPLRGWRRRIFFGWGNLSPSLSSLFSFFSLSSLTDILTWLKISSHAYIYVWRYVYIIYMYMWIILPTFLKAGVVPCLGEVYFSPLNLITHAILIVQIGDLEGTFFYFSSSNPEWSRRGYGLSEWLSQIVKSSSQWSDADCPDFLRWRPR